ncbi:MAG: Hpt domain-containing protein [Treponema sp.]|nr:Hpt domain-containing protein [Treponema sp.]
MKIEISGLDSEYGLGLCDGEEDTYKSSLRLFATNIPNTLEKMRSVNEASLKDYAISVHGVKGMSDYIGALDTRNKAKQLEEKAKNGDIAAVLAENASFIKEVENLVSNVKAWLDKND